MNTSSNSPSPSVPSGPGRWRAARRLLVAAAAVPTLIAVFYTVENWRGQRAWENCRRELEAKGEVLDWTAYIPPPVPDDQNFFKAPKMREWFVKESTSSNHSGALQPPNVPKPFVLASRNDPNLVVAEVGIATPNTPTNSQAADAVLWFEDPAAREHASKLLRDGIGPCAIGAKQCVIVAQPLDQFKPLRWVVQADAVLTFEELTALFPRNPLTNSALAYSDSSYLQVELAGSNTFRVCLKEPVYGAADYLEWIEPLTADFDLVRKTVARPYARIDSDYEQPFLMPIPSFVSIRDVVQILSQRAQSYLLLGQPEAAWHELALVHDLSQILLAKPSGKPITLVAAMINVAVGGLYASVVEDGLRMHAWREPQLLALKRQLKETDLLAPVVEAFIEEWPAHCRLFETTTRGELVKLFGLGGSMSKVVTWMPRGWLFQNLAVGAAMRQEMLGGVDLTNQLVRPHQVCDIVRRVSLTSWQRSPYTFLVAAGQPNYAKALQTLARNQTLVNQARLACALEGYRLVRGQYPETLNTLTPQFIDKLPPDLIGGQPLKYCRTDNGGYLLYSVGWDEKDNSGVPGKSREEGDWVWELR
jgi:hypothetical protein